MYLLKTGATISESGVCRFLQRNNFSRKKLHHVARQRNEQLRSSFTTDCEIYSPEMMFFLDETGCDNRGQHATCVRLLCRGEKS